MNTEMIILMALCIFFRLGNVRKYLNCCVRKIQLEGNKPRCVGPFLTRGPDLCNMTRLLAVGIVNRIASAESGETTVLRANPVWLRGWIVFSICRFRKEIVVSPQFRLALGWRNLTPLTHIYVHAWRIIFLKSNE